MCAPSLEAVIEGLIDRFGFEMIKARALVGNECDTALRALFGSGEKAIETSVRDSLAAYIADLETSVGTDWLYRCR